MWACELAVLLALSLRAAYSGWRRARRGGEVLQGTVYAVLISLPRRSEVVGRACGSGDRVRALLGEAGGGAPLTVSQCRSGCPRHQRRGSLLVTPSALTFMLRSRWGAARGEQGSGSRPQREQLAARCRRSRDAETAVGGQGRPSRSARRSSSRGTRRPPPRGRPCCDAPITW